MMIRVGQHVVNLDTIADAHWEQTQLFVHYAVGGFARFRADDAKVVWQAILDNAEWKEVPNAPVESSA